MDLLPRQLVADKWRVAERLDRAAGGHVYRVDGVPGGEPAVLEVAATPRNRTLGELARFDREARIASHVKHVRLARILDFGTWKERPFVVSEVPRGKPLSALVGTSEMTRSRAVLIGSQVLEVVRHLHAHGVVHRDVTLENVLVIESPAGDQVRLSPPGLGLAGGAARRDDQTGDLLAVGELLQAMCEAPAAEGCRRRRSPRRWLWSACSETVWRGSSPRRPRRSHLPAFSLQTRCFSRSSAREEARGRPRRRVGLGMVRRWCGRDARRRRRHFAPGFAGAWPGWSRSLALASSSRASGVVDEPRPSADRRARPSHGSSRHRRPLVRHRRHHLGHSGPRPPSPRHPRARHLRHLRGHLPRHLPHHLPRSPLDRPHRRGRRRRRRCHGRPARSARRKPLSCAPSRPKPRVGPLRPRCLSRFFRKERSQPPYRPKRTRVQRPRSPWFPSPRPSAPRCSG